MGRMKCLWLLLGVLLVTVSTYDVSADVIPSENECRPYIEKAIHELKQTETTATDNQESTEDATTNEQDVSIENAAENSLEQGDGDAKSEENVDSTQNEQASAEKTENDSAEDTNSDDDNKSQEQQGDSQEVNSDDGDSAEKTENQEQEVPAAGDEDGSKEETGEVDNDSKENADGDTSKEAPAEADDTQTEEQNSAQVDGDSEQTAENASIEPEQAQNESNEEENTATEEVDSSKENADEKSLENEVDDGKDSQQDDATEEKEESVEEEKVRAKRSISDEATQEQENSAQDGNESQENTTGEDTNKSGEEANKSAEENKSGEENKSEEVNKSEENAEDGNKSAENANESQENATVEDETQSKEANDEPSAEATDNASTEGDEPSKEATDEPSNEANDEQSNEGADAASQEVNDGSEDNSAEAATVEESGEDEQQSEETMPEEELTLEFEIPKNLRSRDHISALLGLDAESSIKENALKRTGDVVLKELKKIYDNAVKPLETMYKYRDLSNRHFGDPEMFSKPLVLFMGPWSGGKSTILNYLTDNEYTPNSIRSGAEPSPAHFNILTYGDEPEVLDGTEIAADWTFSGLQKFGQGLMDRLRGQRLPNKLLERVNIVEIPGILEVRKQVSRYFPFNDACQWFIDRADIIFLVYDPSKLDVGPETEAILDQLKGREYQTRILLNKADQVKPEELLRVQGALIWNISPLMSSAQPPVMYTLSLWSHPFEAGAPIRLLQAQERAFLVDLREAIDKRIENKIASARRFAVRIRNHAKMVDCYLTTYYNQKGLFSNKKQISDKIIEHPQDYNIYEGLSTLTNISRYDLPDPEVYLDFFRLNPLYGFKKLSETCTYFKGCPINKLDIAIAYELPELVGKYKSLLVDNLVQLRKEFDENCNQSEPEPPVKINKLR